MPPRIGNAASKSVAILHIRGDQWRFLAKNGESGRSGKRLRRKPFFPRRKPRRAGKGLKMVASESGPTFLHFAQFPATSRFTERLNHFSSLFCEKGRLVRDRGGGGGLPLPPSSSSLRAALFK
jgi:hypothetical protein